MTTRVAGVLAEIREVLARAEDRAELVALLGGLASLQAECLAAIIHHHPDHRMMAARFAASAAGLATGALLRARDHTTVRDDQGWTDTVGAASYLGQTERWIHENWHRLPFARKWDARNLAFNVEGMKRWDGRLLPE